MTISPSSTDRSANCDRKGFEQLGEIAVQRLLVAALDQDLVSVAKDERAKSIPLRFENPFIARRQFTSSLGEHRQDRWVYWKIHASWYTGEQGWGLGAAGRGGFSEAGETFYETEASKLLPNC